MAEAATLAVLVAGALMAWNFLGVEKATAPSTASFTASPNGGQTNALGTRRATDGDPKAKGSPDSRVTIVEYADFQ